MLRLVSIRTGMNINLYRYRDIDHQYRCHKAVSEVEPETALSIIDTIIGIESFNEKKRGLSQIVAGVHVRGAD